MEAIQKSMKEMKMKVEESEIGIKIKKGTTDFVHEHEEEINKVKSKVEETKIKVEERITNNTKTDKRDSCSVDNKDKKDGDIEPASDVIKEDRDDDPIIETDDGANKRPSIKKRVEEFASKVVEPEILKVKSKVLGMSPLAAAAATTTEPKIVTENKVSTSNVEESVADNVESSVNDADGDAEQNITSAELEEETAGEVDLVNSPSSETEKPSEMTDEPKEDGDWNDVLPPPDTEEEGEDEDEIVPPAPSSSIPDYYKSNSKDDDAATTTKTDGTEKSKNEKHINKLKKSIEDIRLKIETTIKEVSDKDKVKKIINPLKMKLVVAKAKIIALKEGKSKSDHDDDDDDDDNNNNNNKEENFVTIAENVTKNVVGNTRNALKKAASKVGLIDDNDGKKTAVEDKDDKNDEETKSKLPKVVGNVRDALKKAVSKVLITEDDKKKPAAAEDNNSDNNSKTDDSIPCDTTKRESDIKTNTADTDTADTVNESDVRDDDNAEGDNESK